MAFCAFCGKEISDQASVCPNCGHPQRTSAAAAVGEALRRTDGNAIASLVLGIAGFVVCPVIPSIVAVILGNKAKANIRMDPNLDGEGLAKAGVILGWIGIGIGVLLLVIMLAAVSSSVNSLSRVPVP